jgi:hypothetical protein
MVTSLVKIWGDGQEIRKFFPMPSLFTFFNITWKGCVKNRNKICVILKNEATKIRHLAEKFANPRLENQENFTKWYFSFFWKKNINICGNRESSYVTEESRKNETWISFYDQEDGRVVVCLIDLDAFIEFRPKTQIKLTKNRQLFAQNL